ncbi:hypothetical protein FPSE_03722 [Fusarium pseudograminearum CS3096]|uniref:Nephrocystin 3-like N-terminal domain-containing protein n=1 Tax=Fusarium pseudograminearum (strain CS3096) TaxID=1028729 RepID=K3W1L1_FUSPC|nr:hypothetical protein FPSE_03722 [Fusarium pseudograminearum CS3096]EKJ76090.1 hypothetical protein FPSE_03722 [Fusarium pseudograminearum CS3096]
MSDPRKYTVGWICAIATEYLAAQLLDEEHGPPESVSVNDSNDYTLGKIGKHNVVMAVLPFGEYGISSATGVAKDMLRSFPNVRIGLMVGIGGGAPTKKHDIRLGDVIVGVSNNGDGAVYQYDFGKTVQGQEFQTTGFLNQPPTFLRTAVQGLLTQYKRKGHQLDKHVNKILAENPRLQKDFQRPDLSSDRLYVSSKVHPKDDKSSCAEVCGDENLVRRPDRGEYEDNPAVHYGLIASSNRLMKDALARDALAAKKGVLCFEMEAAGLMNHFPFLVVRGICDYSDSHKNQQWQGFAAMMAAAYAKDLLHQIPPNKVEAEKPISEVLSSIESLGKETKHAVMSMASDSHWYKIERWLSPSDFTTNANLARQRRHPGTGTWLLESTAFQEWKLGSRQHLWLYGLAGCGKTVLSGTILDHLGESATNHTVLAFFFDFNDIKKQRLEDLLRSLAIQLYHRGNETARTLDRLFALQDNGRKQPDSRALSDCIDAMMKDAGRVFIVIDALDECKTTDEVLRWIGGLASGNVQALITGRPDTKFQSEISQVIQERNCILLDKQSINTDIRIYVKATLETKADFIRKRLSGDIIDEISERIGDGSDGMFRWAACQLESLSRCLSPKHIKLALATLPQDLDETYHRILSNIPAEYKSGTMRLLQFLVHTKRPLKLAEAIEVVATEIDEEPRGFDPNGRLSLDDDILQYCPGLLTVIQVTEYHGVVCDQLHLAHFSVKEYLLKQPKFNLHNASAAISRTCLAYLTDIDENVTHIYHEFPMASYASMYWTTFAVLARDSKQCVQDTVIFLRDQMAVLRWRRLETKMRSPVPSNGDALFYACQFGLLRAAKTLIVEGADVNAQYDRFGTVLQIAALMGHLEIVQLLLDNGADVNAKSVICGNALYAATLKGHSEVVRLLLKRGADVNASADAQRGNALTAASYRGNLEIMQLLLDAGADINASGGVSRSPLQAALWMGRAKCVRLLLDNGAEVNLKGEVYSDVLHTALSPDVKL